MSNIERVTIVLSSPMIDRIRAALAAGAFSTPRETIHRAARQWCAAPERRRPIIDAPSIAGDAPAVSRILLPFEVMPEVNTLARTRAGRPARGCLPKTFDEAEPLLRLIDAPH